MTFWHWFVSFNERSRIDLFPSAPNWKSHLAKTIQITPVQNRIKMYGGQQYDRRAGGGRNVHGAGRKPNVNKQRRQSQVMPSAASQMNASSRWRKGRSPQSQQPFNKRSLEADGRCLEKVTSIKQPPNPFLFLSHRYCVLVHLTFQQKAYYTNNSPQLL